jgi:hypothetical protein
MGRWGVLIVGILAAAAVVGSNAGARTQQLVSPKQAAIPAITTTSGVKQFLHAHGIKATHVVIQNATNNYAGPSCPGITWACTTAKGKVVVQFSHRDGGDDGDNGGDNQYQCSPSTGSGGSSTPPDSCVIVQVSSGAENDATCVESSNVATGASQSCQIFQTNTTGDNNLHIRQLVNAHGGAAQDATQAAQGSQQNGTGQNNAWVHQRVLQQTHDTGAGGSQSQTDHQSAAVGQTSTTGNNWASVKQSQNLDEDINAGGYFGPRYGVRGPAVVQVNQQQDADNSGPNLNSAVYQHSVSGANTGAIEQLANMDASAPNNNVSGSQTQGSPTGGLNGHFDQTSTGLSQASARQIEHQDLDGGKGGGLVQTQYDPHWAGSPQESNPNNVYQIDQRADQHASKGANQNGQIYSNCDTSGTCTATEHVSQNGNNQNNSCTGASCHVGLIVTPTGGTTTCTGLPNSDSENGGTCPAPPLPPPPPGGGCNVNRDVEVAACLTPTTTTVASSQNPTFNGNVTFTATVTPSNATGTVTFMDGNTTLCGNVPLVSTDSGDQATCGTEGLSVGSHVITATYSGDATHSGSSGTVTQVVNLG